MLSRLLHVYGVMGNALKSWETDGMGLTLARWGEGVVSPRGKFITAASNQKRGDNFDLVEKGTTRREGVVCAAREEHVHRAGERRQWRFEKA